MSNINVENKYPKDPQFAESLVAAGVSGYTRGLAVVYGADAFHVALASVAGAQILGLIEEDQVVASGSSAATVPMKIIELGQMVAQIGAAVATPGAWLTVNAAGQLVPAQPGQYVAAISLDSNPNAGDYICVFVCGILGIKAPGDIDAYYAAAGAIAVQSGTAVLNGAAALAMTLAAPTAAQEGTRLFITAATAHAHTVTTPASGINGVHHIVTYAAIGDGILLQAVNGTWNQVSLTGPTPAVIS